MKSHSSQPHSLTAAQRGLVVQRVIVDGWTAAAVAAAAGLPERLVAGWVAEFRKHGMASLRSRRGKGIAADYLDRSLLRPARAFRRGLGLGMRWIFALEQPVAPSPIRQSLEDRRGGS